MTRVLVIDDEPQILRALRINLSVRGYEVITAATGAAALRAAAEHRPDVIVLDLGLPDMSGIEVLEGLRGWLSAPVIVLSARIDSADKVEALDAGADDYVTKPFGMEELLARLRAAVRRAAAATETDEPVVETDSFTVDLAAKRVIKDGTEVHLTPTEWGMLEMLVRNRGKLVGREELLKEVWGPAYAKETHYLRVYLAQLRRKPVVALLGGVAPAALSAVLSGLLLNYFLTEPRYTFTIAEPDAAVTELVLLVVAVAVAALVDNAAKRTREARRASQEAELLALFAGSVLRGADLDTLLERVRETYSQRAVSMLRVREDPDEGEIVACVGKDPCTDVDSADTAIEVGDDEFWMLMAGRKLPASDLRVLTAVAKQAAGLIKQRELAEEASKAEAIAQADELRRSLLSAVSHDLRTPLAAAKAAVSSLRSARHRVLPRGHRRTARNHRGVDRPADRTGGQPARLVAAGGRRRAARTAPGISRGSRQPGSDGNQQRQHRIPKRA